MRVSALSSVILSVSLARAVPLFRRTTLNAAATAQAQVHDNTATRAFSAVPIKTSAGQCLFVDPLSGDFRENLTPVQAKTCDGSAGQQWDVITAGKHNNQPGFALIVSTLTSACLNFDQRRAAGNQVLLFSCGGRGDGSGQVTDSQLFAFANVTAGPLPLLPQNGKNAVCMTIKNGLVDQTVCTPASASGLELFTFGNGTPAKATTAKTVASTAKTTASTAKTTAPPATKAPSATTAAATSVSRAGGVLNPSAVAESQVRDATATRFLSAAQVKTSDGKCLTIDPNAGDFRENLIPVTIAACNGQAGQKFDIITKGVHDNIPNTALIVSSLTQGCLNFDPRRAAGDQVILFSCGGRADGGGAVTNSQTFNFTPAQGKGPLALVPGSGNNVTCLFDNNGKLDSQACTPAKASGAQLFTFA